jgi:hypothetical protein
MLPSVTTQNFYEILNKFTTPQLEELAKQHPFQHELHLLIAKKYQQEKNPAFDEQLQLAAIYAQDRDLFFSLFNEAIPEVEQIGKELYGGIIPAEDLVAEEAFTETISSITEEDETVAAKNEQAEVVTEVTSPVDLAVTNEVLQVSEEVSERTFDEWLKVYQPQLPDSTVTKEPTGDEPIKVEEDELELLIMQNTPVDFLHELVKEETHYSRGLEEFIVQEIKKKKHPESKKSAPENEINPEMVTETLAKLYEMQKKYMRAIKAYQVLALKYPEKNDFFATRINYLQNLL